MAGGGAASVGAAHCAARTLLIERCAFLGGAVTGQEEVGMRVHVPRTQRRACNIGRDIFPSMNKFSFMLDSNAADGMVAWEEKALHVVSRLPAV